MGIGNDGATDIVQEEEEDKENDEGGASLLDKENSEDEMASVKMKDYHSDSDQSETSIRRMESFH